jgi:hypothetical protein
MENTRTIVQEKIMNFLELKERQKKSPDLLTIMETITGQLQCEPITVVNAVYTLRRTTKIIRVKAGFAFTYRVVRHL